MARAMRPSRPSRTAAAATAITAHSTEPSTVKRIAVTPALSAISVTTLGTSRRNGTSTRRAPGRRICGTTSPMASAPAEKPLRLVRAGHRNHRLARDATPAEPDNDAGRVRQVDVDPGAEADEAEAVAGAEPRTLLGETDDATGDEAGDLHDAEAPGRRRR